MRIEINAGGLKSFFDGVSRFTSSGVSNSAQLIKSLQAVRNRATRLPLDTGTLGPALTFIDNRIRNEEHRIASVARVMQKVA